MARRIHYTTKAHDGFVEHVARLAGRKMPRAYYEGAPHEVREQIAYIITLPSNHGAGMTHEILISERLDDGSTLGVDLGPLSVGQHFALNPYELSQYKRANGHRKTKWMDLPEVIRHTILQYINSATLTTRENEEITMTAWNEQNTEGFSPAELATLSNAQNRLASEFPGIDAANLRDMLNNEWYAGIAENELVDAVTKRLHC